MNQFRYESLLNAVSEGVVEFARDLSVIYSNQALARMIGFQPSSMHDVLQTLLNKHEATSQARMQIHEALAAGTAFAGELNWQGPSGQSFWTRLSLKPVVDDTGACTAFIGTLYDISEPKAAEAQYRSLARDHQFIFENVHAGIIIHAPDSAIRYINPMAKTMLGLSDEATLNKTSEQRGWTLVRLDGTPMPQAELPFFRAMHEHAPIRGVVLGHKRVADNAIVWALCDAFPAIDENGAISAVLVSFSDVTRLVETEKAAETYRERFELAARASQDAIFEWNIETSAFYANDAFKTIYGYDPPSLMGTHNLNARNTIGPDEDALRKVTLEALASGKERYSVDHMISRPDGTIGHVIIRAFIVRDPAGKALRVIGTATDVGHLTAALAALEQSEMRFRIIADTVSDVLWDYNFETRQSWITPDWGSRLGLNLTNYGQESREWINQIDPADKRRLLQAFQDTLESDSNIWEAEYRLVSADNQKIDVAVKASIQRKPDGTPLRILGNVRDITALKRQQEGYTRARALEAVGQLTGGVAHDFNNLLMIIQGNAELLAMGTLSHEDAQSVSVISRAAESAAKLTQRLLMFAGQTRFGNSRVDIAAMPDSIWPLLRAGLPESITLSWNNEAGVLNPDVDANGLEQAIVNLAMNAKDAMPDGGEIVISAKNFAVVAGAKPAGLDLNPGQYVAISVQDNGCGMSADVQAKAFEPYFTTKEFGKGTGLGLSTVYGFATQSGGGVTIDGVEGQGTTVTLYLPACQGGNGDDAAKAEASENVAEAGKKRILVVEDQQEVRSHVTKLLARFGYEVTPACDAVSACAMLEEGQTFDLVYTDIIMPGGMNGQQLGMAAARIIPGIKVLYTSGYPASAFESLGIHDQKSVTILRKPYKANQLKEAIAQVLAE